MAKRACGHFAETPAATSRKQCKSAPHSTPVKGTYKAAVKKEVETDEMQDLGKTQVPRQKDKEDLPRKVQDLRKERLQKRNFHKVNAEYPWKTGYKLPANTCVATPTTSTTAYRQQLRILATDKLPTFSENDLQNSRSIYTKYIMHLQEEGGDGKPPGRKPEVDELKLFIAYLLSKGNRKYGSQKCALQEQAVKEETGSFQYVKKAIRLLTKKILPCVYPSSFPDATQQNYQMQLREYLATATGCAGIQTMARNVAASTSLASSGALADEVASRAREATEDRQATVHINTRELHILYDLMDHEQLRVNMAMTTKAFCAVVASSGIRPS